MIPKSKWNQFKKQHPRICGTCYHYEVQDSKSGLCYGLPPIQDGKTCRVKFNRKSCSLHQDTVQDIHSLILSADILSSIVSAVLLFLEIFRDTKR